MKLRRVQVAILLFVLIAIVLLGFKITDLQNQLDTAESNQYQMETLLAGDDNVAGFTCGVLTKQRAKALLVSSENLKQANVQGLSEIVRNNQPAQEMLFWTDSCRYVDTANSSRYIELYITTFQTRDLAILAFPDFLGAVNDAETLPADGYGDELLYEGGVYYLLQGNRVIQVAASNGIPSQTANFSRGVFDSILANF